LLFAFSGGYFSNFVYGKADWNYKDAGVNQAMKAADEKTARMLNATNANLAAFKARGGKLILYHGWNDPAISALNTINYYNDVVSKMGRNGRRRRSRGSIWCRGCSTVAAVLERILSDRARRVCEGCAAQYGTGGRRMGGERERARRDRCDEV